MFQISGTAVSIISRHGHRTIQVKTVLVLRANELRSRSSCKLEHSIRTTFFRVSTSTAAALDSTEIQYEIFNLGIHACFFVQVIASGRGLRALQYRTNLYNYMREQ